MDADLAYLLGAMGDACLVHRAGKGEWCVEFEQKNPAWLANSVIPRLGRLFQKEPRLELRKTGLYRARLYSRRAFETIALALGNLDNLPAEPLAVQAAYVRGFFDAEGSAPAPRPGRSRRVHFYQKDARKLELIAGILRAHGIMPARVTRSRDVGQLTINGALQVRRFSFIFGCEHPDKAFSLSRLGGLIF